MGLDEEISAARRKVVTDGYEMSIGELLSLYKERELDINPAFQRLYRWKKDRKTRFVESILLGIPFPPIFVFTRADGKWELIDGLQRISTLLEFVGVLRGNDNKDPEQPLRLEGTKLLPSLAGKAWNSADQDNDDGLSAAQQLVIRRTRLRVEILKQESDEQAKYELFQRLNTGGAELSEQEVRDCVIFMINRDYHTWLKGLSTSEPFVTTIGLSDRANEQQLPSELVVRFFAYSKVPYETGLDVHDYLDHAAVLMAKGGVGTLADDGRVFSDVFAWIASAISGSAFTRWDGVRFLGAFSIAAYEAITHGLADNHEILVAKPAEERSAFVRQRIQDLWASPEFQQNSGAGVRGTTRLKNLLPFASRFFRP